MMRGRSSEVGAGGDDRRLLRQDIQCSDVLGATFIKHVIGRREAVAVDVVVH